MRKGFSCLAALALVLPAAAHAQTDEPVITCLPPGGGGTSVAAAIETPSLIATGLVGSTKFDLTQCLTRLEKVFLIDAAFQTQLATGTIHVIMNSDPFVNFSLATTNLVAGPTIFQFTFGTPIVPGFYNLANSSLAGSVTDGIGEGSVTNSGTDPFLVGNGTVGGLPAPPSIPGNLGVDIGAGPCVTGAATSANCPPVAAAAANAFAPTFYDDLDATVTYSQSGLLSQATFSGRVELLTSVPEPATLTLIAGGLVALAGAGVLRRRTS